MTTNSKVAKKCDEIIIIENGKILCHKSTDEILTDPYFSKYLEDLSTKSYDESEINDLEVLKTSMSINDENKILIKSLDLRNSILSAMSTVTNSDGMNEDFKDDGIMQGSFRIKEKVIFTRSFDLYQGSKTQIPMPIVSQGSRAAIFLKNEKLSKI